MSDDSHPTSSSSHTPPGAGTNPGTNPGATPRFTGAQSLVPRRSRWWLWVTPTALLVIVLAVVAIKVTSQRHEPAATMAQESTAEPAAPSATPATPAPATPAAAPVPSPAAVAPTPGEPAASPTAGATPAATAIPAATQPTTAPALGADLQPQLHHGLGLIEQGKLVEGRAVLSDLYTQEYDHLDPRDAQAIRDTLSSINQDLVFGPKVTADDPLVELYLVQPGDMLTRVSLKYRIPYPLIETINHVQAPRIRVGQKLKVIKGPFSAVVRKHEFRLDLFLPDAQGRPVYVRSLPVGLGENDSTPVGLWQVNGKLSNPGWTNPRTHQYYAPDDPANPIGEYWLGLRGVDEALKDKSGYGLHGTIDPDSVGKMMSMGCVRLRGEDIALVYQLLYDKVSTVRIEP